MDFRWVIEIDPAGSVSPADIARAVTEFGPGIALLVDHGDPAAILPTTEIAGGTQKLLVSELRGWRPLRPTPVWLSPRGGRAVPETVFVYDDLGIVGREHDHLLVPLAGGGGDRLQLASAGFAIAADTRLPGPGTSLPRIKIPYRCENDHVRWQWLDDRNRSCRRCPGTLRPT